MTNAQNAKPIPASVADPDDRQALAGTDDADLIILGIETSCDETAAAVVVGAKTVLSSVVSSQIDLHARYGGVVPEIASRAHLDLLMPVVSQALVESGLEPSAIDAVAVTHGPGLIGALLVGVSAAKGLSMAWDVPLVAINHLEGHLYAAFLEDARAYGWSGPVLGSGADAR